MDKVNRQIFNAIDEQQTIRIVIILPTNTLNADDFITSASDLIKPFMTQWEAKHAPRLLVVDAYPSHTSFVVDINNHRYDYSIAHKQHFLTPVYILRLSKRNKWRFFRRPPVDARVAWEIAHLHRSNGQNQTPFFAGHINGSVYTSPRMDEYEMPYVQS